MHGNGATASAQAEGPAPQTAWTEPTKGSEAGEAGDAPRDDAGPALIWQASGPGRAVVRYAAARIDRATVARLGELLRVVIAGLVAPDARLETVSPLLADERERVVVEWNRTEVGYRREATVHALFREQAAARPDAPALLWDGGRLSYAELDRWSDALAERLIAALTCRSILITPPSGSGSRWRTPAPACWSPCAARPPRWPR
jgi:hypothetical protein